MESGFLPPSRGRNRPHVGCQGQTRIRCRDWRVGFKVIKKTLYAEDFPPYFLHMKTLFFSLLFAIAVNGADASKDKFFSALASVESGGNAKAENKKENALGIYQIRPLYFVDSKVKANHRDVFKPEVARQVAEAYFKRYEKKAFDNNDFEVLARLHNAGPNWRKKMKATDAYWKKVKKNL